MNFFKRILKKETLSYLFFGGMTTLVDYLVFFLCYNLCSIQELVANAVAFFTAVLFAYTVNKILVFHSKNLGFSSLIREFCSFVGARLLTFALEQLGLWFCGMLGLGAVPVFTLFSFTADGIVVAKLALSVIVVIVNYFLCKFVIFRKGIREAQQKQEEL